MFVLADMADAGTAEIPPMHTPSLRVLAEETGLSPATVKRSLSLLEVDGWVLRDRPSMEAARAHGERTRYKLLVPGGPTESQAIAQGEPTMDHTEPTHGSDGAEGGLRESHIKEESRSLPDLDQIKENVGRADVAEICSHLADRVEENGSKRPAVTKAWRDSARLLLDKDGRTVEQVKRAIDWCQADDFWRANILSMPTLRKQYERLRLAAQRPNARPAGHKPYTNPTDPDAYSKGL
jgi:hypothetical protein